MHDIGEVAEEGRPQYNLLEEPWINVVDTDGCASAVSLRDVLVNAHKIRKFANDMPNQDLPLLRLLVAILYRAYGRNYDLESGEVSIPALRKLWKKEWQTGHFNSQIILDYINQFNNHFN